MNTTTDSSRLDSDLSEGLGLRARGENSGKPRLVLRSNGTTFNPAMAEKYGNNWGKAKITDEQAEEIRRRYATGAATQKQLAEHFKISRGHISKIIRAAVWKHTNEQA